MSEMSALFGASTANLFDRFASGVGYSRGSTVFAGVKASSRGLKGDELFGAAAMGDRLAVVRAADFTAIVGGNPQRFDRLSLPDGVYTVIDWRPAPADDPVFFRLVIRGGTQ
jgi:hypothetical protein